MDNGQDKNPSDNGTAPSTQGLYSTPELTVNTDKITPPPSSPTDRARIASFFADTSTSQQNQQLQNATFASAPATEDIVINPGKKKKGVLPIIIAIVAIIAVISGTAAVFFLTQNNTTTDTAKIISTFQDYYHYLKDGPELPEDDTDEDAPAPAPTNPQTLFLFTLNNANMSTAERQAYITSLKEKYNAFLLAITETDPNFDNIPHATALKRAQFDQQLLNAVINASTLNMLVNQLLNTYVESGSENAYTFIENTTKTNSENDVVTQLAEATSSYLKDELTILEIYHNNGCIEETSINSNCRDEIATSNNSYNNTMTKQTATANKLAPLLFNAQSTLYSETEAFANILGVAQ